jgi:phosphoribosylaminoimidazolecarboxamide formyltransferase/IMP cyclohydrolase
VLYRLLRALCRHALAVFFRRVEVEGIEGVPPEGPLLLAANHPNTLIDVLLVGTLLERQVGFVAKATLFEGWFMNWFLRHMGAVPIHRRQDGATDAASQDANSKVLADCEDAVARGQALVIFPEGVSQQEEPRLLKLKTGLARIALGAEAKAPGQVRVVPAALVYDDPGTFRSRARVTYGEPIPVAPFARLGAEAGDPFVGVRALTAALRDAMVEDVVHVEEGHEELAKELDLLYGTALSQQAGGRLAASAALARALNHFAEREPARVEQVRAELGAYREALADAGVSDGVIRARRRRPGRLADAGFLLGAPLGDGQAVGRAARVLRHLRGPRLGGPRPLRARRLVAGLGPDPGLPGHPPDHRSGRVVLVRGPRRPSPARRGRPGPPAAPPRAPGVPPGSARRPGGGPRPGSGGLPAPGPGGLAGPCRGRGPLVGFSPRARPAGGPMSDVTVRRALLSVADKTGLVPFAQALAERGVELVSTGGTARALREGGLEVIDVSAVTGHPEVFSGRVKTLHPKIHGGILARLPQDAEEMEANGIQPFDLIVVNLYRFEEAAAAGKDLGDLVEEIDIGGPCMVRAAAKSFARVAVVTDPARYDEVVAELQDGGTLSLATRQRLALAAFQRTAAYDRAISATLAERLSTGDAEDAADAVPAQLSLAATRIGEPLRYGENPHQKAGLYALGGSEGLAALSAETGKKQLSYNNLLDVDAALTLAHDLPVPGVCVIKHAGPCGAASADDQAAALEAAWAGDPLSAFGSVVGFNAPVGLAAAQALVTKGFVEVVVAPSFDADAVEAIRARKGWGRSVRLVSATPPSSPALRLRSVAGALLVQDADQGQPARWETVTKRAPTPAEEAALRFAWTCVKHVRSNAIVLAAGEGQALVGVGGGQPSRVDAVEIAVKKAGERAQGGALASDAFFPFPDGVEAAHAAGVTCVVQPGGSKKDADVIARADELGVAMVFTGTRHFRH